MPRALGDEMDDKNVIRLTVSCHRPAFPDGITIAVLICKSRRACPLESQGLLHSPAKEKRNADDGAVAIWLTVAVASALAASAVALAQASNVQLYGRTNLSVDSFLATGANYVT